MTTTKTNINVSIPAELADKKATPKQMVWLQSAERQYSLKLDWTCITTIAEASANISRIQGLINKKELIAVQPFWYCIVIIDGVVSIKSFNGTQAMANKKALDLYGLNFKYIHSDLDKVKKYALITKESLTRVLANKEVAVTTESVVEETITSAELELLSIDELKELAKSMNVDLGRSRAKSTIISRILA